MSKKNYQILSPDGFTIEREPHFYTSKKKALKAFSEWKSRYKQQGYYSSSKFGRIHLLDLSDYCQFINF